MAKCDLCGGSCNANEMLQLRSDYQIPGVLDLCKGCVKWTDKVRSEMLLEVANNVCKAVAKRHAYFHPNISNASFWQRVLQKLGFSSKKA